MNIEDRLAELNAAKNAAEQEHKRAEVVAKELAGANEAAAKKARDELRLALSTKLTWVEGCLNREFAPFFRKPEVRRDFLTNRRFLNWYINSRGIPGSLEVGVSTQGGRAQILTTLGESLPQNVLVADYFLRFEPSHDLSSVIVSIDGYFQKWTVVIDSIDMSFLTKTVEALIDYIKSRET